MKFTLIKLLVLSGLYLLASQSFAANTRAPQTTVPSFGFVQETASVTDDGDVTVDLYNTTNYRNTIRVGAFGGEILLSPAGGNAGRGVGFKSAINSDFAWYGMLFLDNDASFTNLTVGAAYTKVSSGFIYNANLEIFSQSDAGGGISETFMDVRGSVFYPISIGSSNGTFSLGLEVDLEVSPNSVTDIYIGGRWMPNPNVVLDLGLFESIGAPSPIPAISTVATPAFFRLNVTF